MLEVARTAENFALNTRGALKLRRFSSPSGTTEIRFVTSQHLVSGISVRTSSIAVLSFAASLTRVYKTLRSVLTWS